MGDPREHQTTHHRQRIAHPSCSAHPRRTGRRRPRRRRDELLDPRRPRPRRRVVAGRLPGAAAIIDVLAAVSTRAWLAGPPAVRALVRRTALASILVSVLGNAAAHLIAAGLIRPGIALVIAVAMAPPLALGVVAHLAASLSAAAPQTAPETTLEVEPASGAVDLGEPAQTAAAPDTATGPAPDVEADSRPDTKRTPRRTATAARVAMLRDKHPDASAAELARRLGVSDRTVRRHLAALAAA